MRRSSPSATLPIKALQAEFGLSKARVGQIIHSLGENSRPITVTLKCEVCGRPFETVNTSKKKCSEACRGRALRLPGKQFIVPDEMCRLLKRGRSVAEIARFFAMPIPFVRRTIAVTLRKKALTAARRRLEAPPGPKRMAAIVALRKQGLIIPAIAEEFGN